MRRRYANIMIQRTNQIGFPEGKTARQRGDEWLASIAGTGPFAATHARLKRYLSEIIEYDDVGELVVDGARAPASAGDE